MSERFKLQSLCNKFIEADRRIRACRVTPDDWIQAGLPIAVELSTRLAADRWTPAWESLPEQGVTVLAVERNTLTGGPNVVAVQWTGETWQSLGASFYAHDEIMAWRPMPLPPAIG